ncbi:hypothetical protein CBR_g12489 [Chara braunii]|uniref:DUF668 domain-containing protein n=1 Tax=Chara braunii TaxID=69332 RepID=A0A388JSI5_CHABU|nr:hypothetical protein CBR_g12489 [Chara braunii]|eukprot:GBG60751.1 hypothetical protein CBR_g12489 [Chara braunii]
MPRSRERREENTVACDECGGKVGRLCCSGKMGALCFRLRRGRVSTRKNNPSQSQRSLHPQGDNDEEIVGLNESDRGKKRGGGGGNNGSGARITDRMGQTVSAVGGNLKRVGSAGVGKAKQAFDALGTVGNLGFSSSFSGVRFRGGDRIGIIAFEVANVVVKALNLRQAISESDMKLLEEVISSYGVQQLVSHNRGVLWRIAAADMKAELDTFGQEVVRLGKQCSDPDFHWLDGHFQKMRLKPTPEPQCSPRELDSHMKVLEDLVTATADLYHELHALETLQGALKRRQQEEDCFPGSQKENIPILKAELKQQDKLVKELKRTSLWSKRLEWVVGLLVDVVYMLNKQVAEAFPDDFAMNIDGGGSGAGAGAEGSSSSSSDAVRLGSSGMALHYANIIIMIDNMVSRPSSVALPARDNLYQMLPNTVKRALKAKLLKESALENETASGLKMRIDGVMEWLLAMASNTIRYSSERRLQGHTEVLLLQTLHHARQDETEKVILDLIEGLHHFISKLTRGGTMGMVQFSNNVGQPSSSRSPPTRFHPGMAARSVGSDAIDLGVQDVGRLEDGIQEIGNHRLARHRRDELREEEEEGEEAERLDAQEEEEAEEEEAAGEEEEEEEEEEGLEVQEIEHRRRNARSPFLSKGSSSSSSSSSSQKIGRHGVSFLSPPSDIFSNKRNGSEGFREGGRRRGGSAESITLSPVSRFGRFPSLMSKLPPPAPLHPKASPSSPLLSGGREDDEGDEEEEEDEEGEDGALIRDPVFSSNNGFLSSSSVYSSSSSRAISPLRATSVSPPLSSPVLESRSGARSASGRSDARRSGSFAALDVRNGERAREEDGGRKSRSSLSDFGSDGGFESQQSGEEERRRVMRNEDAGGSDRRPYNGDREKRSFGSQERRGYTMGTQSAGREKRSFSSQEVREDKTTEIKEPGRETGQSVIRVPNNNEAASSMQLAVDIDSVEGSGGAYHHRMSRVISPVDNRSSHGFRSRAPQADSGFTDNGDAPTVGS